MKKKDEKEVDAAFDSSLRRAKSTYNWVIGAKEALEKEKEREDKALVKTTKVKFTKVLSTKLEDIRTYFGGYYIVPNRMDEALSKLLQPSEEIIYRKLYRWSWGYNRNYCQTSYSILSKETNIRSTKTIREAVHRLIEKGFIERVGEDSLTDPKGSTYLVHIPQLDDDNKLSFIDVNSLVKNTKVKSTLVDNTKVESTKETLVKNTKVDNTKVESPNQETLTQRELAKPENNTLVKNTLVEFTHKDKHINTNNKKQTLSPYTLTKKFYSLLNQDKISKQKRERALRQINELIKEGFSLKDIDFAIEWTVKNKSNLHSFGIIAETIGEALSEREKYLKIQQEKERLENEKRERERKQREEESLQRKIQEIKNSLPKEELAKIHREAEKIVKAQGNEKKFGQDILVRVKENEIIRNLYLQKPRAN